MILQLGFLPTQRADRVALHQHVAVGEQLDGLERGAVRADEACASLHKARLVPHHAADLQDLARDVVLRSFLIGKVRIPPAALARPARRARSAQAI